MTSPHPERAEPILLAFSGGLDTSFCVPWLKDTYQRPVITVTVDTGGIDTAAAKSLAERSVALGASEHHLIDARGAYFDQVLKFLIMGNVRRGNLYPLSVGIGNFFGTFDRYPGQAMATAVLAILLPALIFFLAQRQFTQGIVITGVDK